MKCKVLFLIVLTLILSCSKTEDGAEQKKSSKDTYVTVAKSQVREFTYQESAIGTIEGIIDPTVASEVSGKITKIYVRPGMSINKGQLMAEVDPSDTSYQLSLSEAEVKN